MAEAFAKHHAGDRVEAASAGSVPGLQINPVMEEAMAEHKLDMFLRKPRSTDDALADMKPDTIQRGLFGINIHRASADQRSIQVGKWSAGCQVVADPRDFAQLMDICSLAEDVWGPAFCYTLLLEEHLKQDA